MTVMMQQEASHSYNLSFIEILFLQEKDDKNVGLTLILSVYLVSPPSSRFLKSRLVHVENFSRM